MNELLDKFTDLFPNISFDICYGNIKSKLSMETISSGEREIKRMLTTAKSDLAKVKKCHKKGKCVADEVFECEWRVHELELELLKFNDSTSSIDEDPDY